MERTLGPVRTRTGDELMARLGPGACEIRMNGHELMSSRGHASEDALGRLGCTGLPAEAAVLIGGLGLGYTLRAALDALADDAHVVLAELVPEIVAWIRGPLAPFAGNPLADPRVTVAEGDVRVLLQASRARFDAVLLDVDNGPDGRVRAGNAWLGTPAGLAVIGAALRRPGRLALWSADAVPAFEGTLRMAGFAITVSSVTATEQGGPVHTVYCADLT